MVVFILTWLYIGFTLEVCPFFWDILDNGSFENPYFFYVSFLFFFLLNYFIFLWKELFNNNKDVLYKFYTFCFKITSVFITLVITELKKFYYFLVRVEYKILLKTIYTLFFLKLNNFFIIWRPLFRKWSYFGFYKTNRSKWWKNK